jgi:hypothetical protein
MSFHSTHTHWIKIKTSTQSIISPDTPARVQFICFVVILLYYIILVCVCVCVCTYIAVVFRARSPGLASPRTDYFGREKLNPSQAIWKKASSQKVNRNQHRRGAQRVFQPALRPIVSEDAFYSIPSSSPPLARYSITLTNVYVIKFKLTRDDELCACVFSTLSPKSRYHIIFVESEIYGDDIYLKTAKSSSAQLLMILARVPTPPPCILYYTYRPAARIPPHGIHKYYV